MLFLLLGCAPDPGGDVVWAVNYATVTVDAFGIEGQHVWAFYSDGWERSHDEAYHACSMLQTLTGDAIDPIDGCTDCEATYTVETVDLESDCPGTVGAEPAFGGVAAIGIGSVAGDLADDDPHPGDSLGWYLSFDGVAAESHGWAYADDLDYGRDVDDGWVNGQTYTLWPAYAWDLGE